MSAKLTKSTKLSMSAKSAKSKIYYDNVDNDGAHNKKEFKNIGIIIGIICFLC